MWSDLSDKLLEWESGFLEKSEEEFKEEKEHFERELPKIKAERNAMARRLHKLDQIIAKTKILIDDLSEDYCKYLSKGRSIAEVAEIIKRNLGKEIDDDFGNGKKNVVKFLSEYLKIDKSAARKLFDLLEEEKVLLFSLDAPDGFWTNPVTYVPLQDDFDVTEPIVEIPGKWTVNA